MAKSGPVDEKLNRSLTQLQNIFSSLEKILPKHLNPEYENIFQQYTSFFDKSSFSEQTLKNICEFLKREGIRLEYQEKEEDKIQVILARYYRVCITFFFLDYIIPRFPSFVGAAHFLREILIRDISIVFYHCRCLFHEEKIPAGQRVELYNIIAELKMLHHLHAAEYDNFTNRVLTKNTPELEAKEVLSARRNLLRSFTYTIDIEIDYATLCYLWGDFAKSLTALEAIIQPKKRVEEQYDSIVALSQIDSVIAKTTWSETQKQIDKLTANFDKEIPPLHSRLYKAMLLIADVGDAFLLKLKCIKNTPAWASSLADESLESLIASIKNEYEYYTLPAKCEGLVKCFSEKTVETLRKTVAKISGDFKILNAADMLKVIPTFTTLLSTWRHLFSKEKVVSCYIIIDILDNLVKQAVLFKKEWSPKAQEMTAKLDQERKEQEAKEKEKKKEKKERKKQKRNAAALNVDNKEEHSSKEQEVANEEALRLKTFFEEQGRVRAEKMSKHLLADGFVPTYLPFIPTQHKIKLPQKVLNLLTTLNKAGYWAVVVGGAVRDTLLEVNAKDYDIITNCLKTELAETLKTQCVENPYIPGLYHINHDATEKKVEIFCITCPLMEALQNRDFTINTFIADRHGQVYDLLRVIEHLKAKVLYLLGDPCQRLSDDPKKIFRLLNLSSRLQMEISSVYLAPLKIAAKNITKKLAFSVYLKKVESLFLEGGASGNLQKLDLWGIRGFITPLSRREFNQDLRAYEFYLGCKLKEIDRKENQKQVSASDILALLIFPCYLELKSEEEVTKAFIGAYEGPFSNIEKNAFQNEMPSLLKIYFAEYTEYQRSILIFQNRANQESDNHLQKSQKSLLTPALPLPVTFAYPVASSRGNETSLEKLTACFKACNLEISDKRQNPLPC